MPIDLSDLGQAAGPAAPPAPRRLDLSDLGRPREGAGIDLSDLGAPRKPGSHPDAPLEEAGVSVPERLKLGVAPSPAAAAKWLGGQGYDAAVNAQGRIVVRKAPTEPWRPVNPKGIDLGDPLDYVPDVADIAIGTAGMVAGAGGGPAGAAAGSALGSMASAAAKAATAKAIGFDVDPDQAGADIAISGAFGGAVPFAAAGIGKALKPLAPLAKKIVPAGASVQAAKEAVKGVVRAVPQAAKAGVKGAVQGGLGGLAGEIGMGIPGLSTAGGLGLGGIRAGRELLKGLKQGWALGMSRPPKISPEIEAAIVKAIREGTPLPPGMLPQSEISPAAKEFLKRGMVPEKLPGPPAVQEIAKKAAAGQPLTEFEDSILGRSIGAAANEGPPIEAVERAVQQLMWESKFLGSATSRGVPGEVTWARRTTSKRLGGQQAGELSTRRFFVKPSFDTRGEIEALFKNLKYSEEDIRDLLRSVAVKGLRDGKSVHGGTPVKIVVFAGDNPRGTWTPLESLGRSDLLESYYQHQADVITRNKGGPYNPVKYGLGRLIDLDKSQGTARYATWPIQDLVEEAKRLKVPGLKRESTREEIMKGILQAKNVSERHSWISVGFGDVRDNPSTGYALKIDKQKYTVADLEKIGNAMWSPGGTPIKPAGGWPKPPTPVPPFPVPEATKAEPPPPIFPPRGRWPLPPYAPPPPPPGGTVREGPALPRGGKAATSMKEDLAQWKQVLKGENPGLAFRDWIYSKYGKALPEWYTRLFPEG